MSNETMTDAALLDWLGRSLHACEGQSRQDSRDLYDHIAARLRGEAQAEQQALAWYTEDHLTDKSATTYSAEVAERWRNKGWPVHPLYARPQPAAPAPVAGDAVAKLLNEVLDVCTRTSARMLFPAGFPDRVRAALAQDRASQAGAASAPYSIDADPDGIRERVADAITGVLSFGAQGAHKPPAGHWLEPFWDIARAEREASSPPTVGEATARRLDDYLGGEFAIRIGKQAAHAAIVHALAQQPADCDMGDLCIGCEPRNADGSCPDQQEAR